MGRSKPLPKQGKKGEMKVNTNAQCNKGYTALHYAAAHNSDCSIIKLLLAAGADPSIRSGDGKTAYDIAKARGFKEAEELLEKCTAVSPAPHGSGRA